MMVDVDFNSGGHIIIIHDLFIFVKFYHFVYLYKRRRNTNMPVLHVGSLTSYPQVISQSMFLR